MGLDKNTTGLIVLGASSFPKSKNFSSDSAFLAAKDRIVTYFKSSLELQLDDTAILDVFDSKEHDSLDEIDISIRLFIDNLKNTGLQDLFIYYVGHGSFTRDQQFYLATNFTRDESPATSSITFKSLSETITDCAHKIRTYIILDCCFAGAATQAFQSDYSEVVTQQVKNNTPTKGTALLCATSKDLPALIIKERQITMFTEGLHHALNSGDPKINKKYLSLRQIHTLTYSFIKELNLNGAIHPEILSPIQPLGDIADIDLFYNYSFLEPKSDIVQKRKDIGEEIMKNNIQSIAKSFIDFVSNFDQDGKFFNQSIMIGSTLYDLLEEKGSISFSKYCSKRNSIYSRILEIIEEVYTKYLKSLNDSKYESN